ncbi:amidase [Alcaligenaceae bacterium]|nr:amidase [Alcaligenaceae bacterium]
MQKNIAFSSLADLMAGLQNKDYSCVELTQIYLDRIARYDEKAHAYVHVYAEAALLQAKAADLQRLSGLPLPALHGLPIALKDLAEIAGQITTAGSQPWATRTSKVTSSLFDRLQAAGMIILGKTHMVEFALGGWGTNMHMGTPRNPWDWDSCHRVPGGSSSGSGVAVAAGLVPAAIGSDTGGSIRIPAGFNGLTGLKTTQGLISMYGHMPMSPSFDTIGTLTRTAHDAALLTSALVGFDERDSLTHGRASYVIDINPQTSIKGLRVAVMPPSQYPSPITDEIQNATDEAVRTLESLGAHIIDRVQVPWNFAELFQHWSIIAAAEAYQVHADYIEDPALAFDSWVQKRIVKGKEVDANTYLLAMENRRQTIAKFTRWMESFDVLLTPTLPIVACAVKEVDEESSPAVFTRTVNYLDACALSLPAGFSKEGLPIGVQLIAKPWHENLLLRTGRTFQSATDWHLRTPPSLRESS